jgi:hypothetical protein
LIRCIFVPPTKKRSGRYELGIKNPVAIIIKSIHKAPGTAAFPVFPCVQGDIFKSKIFLINMGKEHICFYTISE